jgi:hypothetical protein
MHLPDRQHPPTTRAYLAAQSAMAPGIDATVPLQVDAALEHLRNALDFHVETVAMLLRRLEPVTGQLEPGEQAKAGANGVAAKVLLACQLDDLNERLSLATGDVQAAIRALQL